MRPRLKVVSPPAVLRRRGRRPTLFAVEAGLAKAWTPQQMLDYVQRKVLAGRALAEGVLVYWDAQGRLAWWAAGTGQAGILHLLEAAKLSVLKGTD